MSTESLLKEIPGKVNNFVGEAEWHDDLTANLMSVSE